MKIIERLDDSVPMGSLPVVATIGNFDGLHRGHQAIMQRVVERARACGGTSAVVTFDPHPLRVLVPERAPRLLLTYEQKLAEIERLGLDMVVIVPFDSRLADMPAERFVQELLVARMALRELYVGPDFRFGRERTGDIELLRRIGPRLGFEAQPVGAVLDGQERISASRIRDSLDRGDVVEASRLLGRPFALIGTIVRGEGRGRELLVPTANLAVENEFIPARGVYITRSRGSERPALGVTNVGVRPTFGEGRLVVETHLPGFEGNLYGSRIQLDFLERLRKERQFESLDQLRLQIARDVRRFESWLAASGFAPPGG